MRKLLLLSLSLLVALTGCVNRDDMVDISTATNGKIFPDLTASFESSEGGMTRTYVENGYLRWHEGDRITAFFGNTLNREYEFNGSTGDNGGTFSYVANGVLGTGNSLPAIYSVYPYRGDISITEHGVIGLDLPLIQTYSEGGFGQGANTMVAVTNGVEDTFLSFKNVGGYLKVKLYSQDEKKVKHLVLKGNDSEKISGPATLTATYNTLPELEMGETARKSITIDCGDGVTLGASAQEATEFWFVVPPTEFTKGITIEVYSDNNGKFVKSTSNNIVIERNIISTMEPLVCVFVPCEDGESSGEYVDDEEVEQQTTDEKYVVYYTTTDGNSLEYIGSYSYEKSHSRMEDGRWKIEFSGTNYFSGFRDRSKLVTLEIGEGVKSVDNIKGASLTDIKIPSTSSVPYLSECAKLENVTIANGVKSIGWGVFENCTSLKSINIPNSVTSISGEAFKGCTALVDVTIPASVASISSNVFQGCTNLKTLKGDNISQDGKALVVNGAMIMLLPDGIETYNVPAGVTSIVGFAGCTTLKSITLPSGLESIGGSAFEGCTNLESINIPQSVTYIGTDAFKDCPKLGNTTEEGYFLIVDGVLCDFIPVDGVTTCTVPEAVKSIDVNAFRDVSVNLTEFKGKFASTDGRCLVDNGVLVAFASSGITEYVTPSGINKIGDYAFSGSPLKKITISEGVEEIGKYAFRGGSGSYVNGYYVFDSSLEDVYLPNSLKIIGHSAFYGCSKLRSLSIPDGVTSLGEYAFDRCYLLETVKLPGSIKELSVSLFYQCANLRSIVVPDGVEIISGQAFYECSSLESIELPNTLKELGASVFNGCSSLKTIIIPESVEEIGQKAFYYCVTLKSAIINGGSLADAVFCGCSNLESLLLNDGVTRVGPYAFENCYKLSEVVIPSTCTNIAEYAFQGCSNLKSVLISDGMEEIQKYAFNKCVSLSKVSLPETLVKIGKFAFDGCDNLHHITIPKSVKYMAHAFDGGSLKSVEFAPGLSVISDYSFRGCPLEKVSIPSSVERIGKSAFAEVYKMTSLNICNGVKFVDSEAFSLCTGLVDVNLGQSITYIGESAFEKCFQARISLHEGLEEIGGNAFYECYNLENVIPASIKKIGYNAFYMAFGDNINYLFVKATEPPVVDDRIGFSGTIYVPKESYELYINDDYWKIFGRYKPISY